MSGQCPNCGVWLNPQTPRVGDVYLHRGNGYLYRVTEDWSKGEYASVERLHPPPGPSPSAEFPPGVLALWRGDLTQGHWMKVPSAALPALNKSPGERDQ